MTAQARLNHLGVVHHQKVARAQKLFDVGEVKILNHAVRNVQQARGRAVCKRILRNEFFGKIEVVVGQMLTDQIVWMQLKCHDGFTGQIKERRHFRDFVRLFLCFFSGFTITEIFGNKRTYQNNASTIANDSHLLYSFTNWETKRGDTANGTFGVGTGRRQLRSDLFLLQFGRCFLGFF